MTDPAKRAAHRIHLPFQPHRVSVRSVTANRRTSRDAACTMIIGRDVSHLGPTNVKATNITCSSAVISWLPANSNHQHVVCVNNVEVRTLKPGVYRHTITGEETTAAEKSILKHRRALTQHFFSSPLASRSLAEHAIPSDGPSEAAEGAWSAATASAYNRALAARTRGAWRLHWL